MTDSGLGNMLNTPLRVGNRQITSRLVLAPMTFLGHVAFRELLAGFGGYGLLFTEMCSAKRIPHERGRLSAYFRWRAVELPHLVCQIVGDDPPSMATAARIIEESGFFGVDINFGCCAATICKRQWGAALLKEPDRAAEIVAAVRDAVSLPLFVKYRTGWTNDCHPAVALAQQFEAAGADALTFHPRVAPDRRRRPARWDYIAKVKNSVSLPVFGNGDVFSRDDCRRMLQTTGCDGVALGRIAIARPWVFAEWTLGYQLEAETAAETAIQLANLLEKHFEPSAAVRRFQKFATYYAANFRYGHTFLSRVQRAADLNTIRAVCRRFFAENTELIQRPNMNFFD